MQRSLFLTGNVDTAEWRDYPKKGSLEVLQNHVGGRIEGLVQGTGWMCYVNEEGINLQLPQNESVAYLLDHMKAKHGGFIGLVWGPAVFCFEGKGKAEAMKLADDWFQTYKSGKLHEPEDSDNDDDEPIYKVVARATMKKAADKSPLARVDDESTPSLKVSPVATKKVAAKKKTVAKKDDVKPKMDLAAFREQKKKMVKENGGLIEE
jgi:hypothetical protein